METGGSYETSSHLLETIPTRRFAWWVRNGSQSKGSLNSQDVGVDQTRVFSKSRQEYDLVFMDRVLKLGQALPSKNSNKIAIEFEASELTKGIGQDKVLAL